MSLESLFRPQSVAVIGASNDPQKFGGRVARNILNSRIPVRYYVNASGGEVLGERSFARLEDLPAAPDAVVVAIPAKASIAALRTAGEMGARAGVVFASGFRETGGEGVSLERELVDVARRYGLSVIGPNCVGSMNFADEAYLSSTGVLQGGRPGSIALIAQSGSLGIAVSSRRDRRFRYFISTGNEAIVRASDLLAHLVEADPGIGTFALMLETIHDRVGLANAAAAAARRGKRVVMLKLADSGASGKIAALHTGAVSGDRAPLEAYCRDHGILLTHTLREFNAVLTLLASTSYGGGNRLGIFTTSGGTAVLSADFAEARGLTMPQPDPDTCSAVAEVLGMQADRVTNPLDTTGIYSSDNVRLETALTKFAMSGCYDLVLVPLGGAAGRIAAQRVESVMRVAAGSAVPVVPVWQHQRLLEEDAFQQLYASGIAMYTDYESPIEAMSVIAGAGANLHSKTDRSQPHGDALELTEALAAMVGIGVPVARFVTVDPGADAGDILRRLGAPIALKVSHRALLHKSDAHLVVFPVESEQQFKDEVARMRQSAAALGLAGAAVVAQAGVAGGLELLCGFARDVEVGAYAVVAAGGVYTEILRDSAVVLLELECGLEQRLEECLRRLQIWPILAGARGRPPYDWAAARTTLACIARWFVANGAVHAMEVNPLIILPNDGGAQVVDARILRQADVDEGHNREGRHDAA
jgi:acyl-CoA synthetase (NDP forming)